MDTEETSHTDVRPDGCLVSPIASRTNYEIPKGEHSISATEIDTANVSNHNKDERTITANEEQPSSILKPDARIKQCDAEQTTTENKACFLALTRISEGNYVSPNELQLTKLLPENPGGKILVSDSASRNSCDRQLSKPKEEQTSISSKGVIKPAVNLNLRLDAYCHGKGCGVPIYDVRYKCLDCVDFDFCIHCMANLSQTHPAHRFVPVYDPISFRGNMDSSTVDEGSPTEQSRNSITYLVKTVYAYEYRDWENKLIRVLNEHAPRNPTDLQRQELSVVEKRCCIRTHYTAAAKPSDEELLSVDSSKATVVMTVHSTMILNALRDIVRYYPGYSLWDGTLVSIPYPYLFVSHHREQLLAYKSHHPPCHDSSYVSECNSHIDELVRFLDQEFDDLFNQEEERWEQEDPMIAFENLWHLFKPGQEIYAREDDELDPYIIQRCDPKADEGKSFGITAWNINFDGVTLGRSRRDFNIQQFKGERRITELDVFPARFYDNEESEASLHERLIDQGKMFFKISKNPSYMEYTGFTLDPPRQKFERARIICDASCEPWADVFTSRENDNQAVLKQRKPWLGQFTTETSSTYQQCTCHACKSQLRSDGKPNPFAEWDRIDRYSLESLTDQQYFLCSRLLYGYVLKERGWHLFDVKQISEPVFDENAIDKLVLEDDKAKDMIKAICMNFTRKHVEDHYSADFIQGKGEGQIFLLHGPPGVGKTLTAECVSEFTHRPLLPLTTGDIGVNSKEVEQNLRRFLKRGQAWNAVVLLDEADVYLGTRDVSDLERNSVVSVFLREIEYYRGILFLTTNRVGGFDEAIISRIHFPLHLKTFDPLRRRKVWENNIKKLQQERTDIEVHYHVVQYVEAELSQLNWNGREIRNAFQTAVSLAIYAAYQKPRPTKPGTGSGMWIKLEKEHIAEVVNMSNNFKRYIDRTRDEDPSTIAKQQKLRDDSFGQEPEDEYSPMAATKRVGRSYYTGSGGR